MIFDFMNSSSSYLTRDISSCSKDQWLYKFLIIFEKSITQKVALYFQIILLKY